MYDPNDPYRYGAPTPPPPAMAPSSPPLMGTHATGKEILSATWRLLQADRELLVLPVMSTISAVIAGAILFAPGWAIGSALAGTSQAGAAVGGVLAAYAMSSVAIFFQAALVIGANERANGGDPTLPGVIGQAWALKGRILGWAAVTTTVGLVLRAVEERMGLLGKIIGLFAGLGWAVASFFAVPVIVTEGLGPIEAIKRSAAVIQQTWGTSLRTTLRFGIVQFLATAACIVAIVLGIVALASGSTAGIAAGAVLIIAGILALVLISVIAAAVTSYARALIFRYATGRPVPGMPPQLLAGAFMRK